MMSYAATATNAAVSGQEHAQSSGDTQSMQQSAAHDIAEPSTAATPSMTSQQSSRPTMPRSKGAILHLVLDAAPIISHAALPTVSEAYYTTPAVIAELKDASARERLDLLRLASEPRFVVRSPRTESLAFVKAFATKTGDAGVLSRQDLEILALTYELECELNGGDWRLRREPGQKGIRGGPPVQEGASEVGDVQAGVEKMTVATQTDRPADDVARVAVQADEDDVVTQSAQPATATSQPAGASDTADSGVQDEFGDADNNAHVDGAEEEDEEEDDDDGWITPANINRHKQKQEDVSTVEKEERVMKVACATHDFAMQNVLLQVGLNLVSQDGKRISTVKTWVLRCYACFKTTRTMSAKFCPSCGGATLLRTSVSTDAKGQTKLHLKRNFQYKTRGTVYDIPAQKSGTSNMKGRDNLILRADQREVQKLEKREKYRKEVDLLDQDTLPSILSGNRKDHGQFDLQVGFGRRNPNAVGRRRK